MTILNKEFQCDCNDESIFHKLIVVSLSNVESDRYINDVFTKKDIETLLRSIQTADTLIEVAYHFISKFTETQCKNILKECDCHLCRGFEKTREYMRTIEKIKGKILSRVYSKMN